MQQEALTDGLWNHRGLTNERLGNLVNGRVLRNHIALLKLSSNLAQALHERILGHKGLPRPCDKLSKRCLQCWNFLAMVTLLGQAGQNGWGVLNTLQLRLQLIQVVDLVRRHDLGKNCCSMRSTLHHCLACISVLLESEHFLPQLPDTGLTARRGTYDQLTQRSQIW